MVTTSSPLVTWSEATLTLATLPYSMNEPILGPTDSITTCTERTHACSLIESKTKKFPDIVFEISSPCPTVK